MKLKNACISACAVGLVAVACQQGTAVGTATTTALGIVDNTQAINLIAYSRCNRDEECQSIGPRKSWESFDACLRETTRNTRATLGADRCPQGVLADRMDECLRDIAKRRCDRPLDSLETIASCRWRYVCRGQM